MTKMMAAYPQHPNQLQHQVQQQGPQQHLQGHPGQAQAMAMQQMHPHQQQNVAYQQAQMAARQYLPVSCVQASLPLRHLPCSSLPRALQVTLSRLWTNVDQLQAADILPTRYSNKLY